MNLFLIIYEDIISTGSGTFYEQHTEVVNISFSELKTVCEGYIANGHRIISVIQNIE